MKFFGLLIEEWKDENTKPSTRIGIISSFFTIIGVSMIYVISNITLSRFFQITNVPLFLVSLGCSIILVSIAIIIIIAFCCAQTSDTLTFIWKVISIISISLIEIGILWYLIPVIFRYSIKLITLKK